MNAAAQAPKPVRLINHFFLVKNEPAQHAVPAEIIRLAGRVFHAAIDFHRVAPDQNKGAPGMVPGKLDQAVAIKRRFFTKKRGVFRFCKMAV